MRHAPQRFPDATAAFGRSLATAFSRNTPRFKVQGNTVSADFGKTDVIARFKLVREDGRYKIDNSVHISPAFREKWWR